MLTRQAGRGIRCFYRALSVLALAGSILLTCILGRDDARALEIEFSGRQVKLDILALYDSKREKQPDQTRIHRFAEIVNDGGLSAPVRTPRGRDIFAACGQLKSASQRGRREKVLL